MLGLEGKVAFIHAVHYRRGGTTYEMRPGDARKLPPILLG
jgi:hypothetical protein